ncbi:MAG: c-type cytochrome [Acidobacteria bacterium]|nr:c-type cytochrome [Acidobacteriota bacterium]
MNRSVLYCYSPGTMVLMVAALILAPAVGAQVFETTPKSEAVPVGNAQNGKRIFTAYGCYQCHGYEGQGAAAAGPRIALPSLALPEFAAYVRQPAGQMPPYTKKVVADSEMADIYAFLQSRPKPPLAKDIPLLND